MVNLSKKGTVYITDGYDIDEYFGIDLDNRGLFHILGRAYSIGYSGEFVIGKVNSDNTDTWLMMVGPGTIRVNWDAVRKLPKEAWNVNR